MHRFSFIYAKSLEVKTVQDVREALQVRFSRMPV